MTDASPRPLRIGVIAPVSWPVPPAGYGPWEQVAYNIVEDLCRRGHEVTIFAAAGSTSSATVVDTVPHALSLWPKEQLDQPRRYDPQTGLLEGPPNLDAYQTLHIATAIEAARGGAFDVLHSHLHIHALPFGDFLPCPLVSTLHGAAWVRAAHPTFDRFKHLPFVSLSYAERTLKPDLNYVANVYNGVNLDRFAFEPEKADYLLFAGRLSPEKGPDKAVQIAKKAGRPLKLAGLIEDQYRDWYVEHVEKHLTREIEYLGCLDQEPLAKAYQKAAAVLFPINWCEPCSMVGIETQACGTPIVGTRYGYLPELIRDGVTGYLVDTVDEAAEAVGKLDALDPAACRQNVEQRFSIATMGAGYEAAFRSLVA